VIHKDDGSHANINMDSSVAITRTDSVDDKKQEDDNNGCTVTVTSGQSFDTFDCMKRYIDKYAMNNGFNIVITKSHGKQEGTFG
jgi:hypothetical protein